VGYTVVALGTAVSSILHLTLLRHDSICTASVEVLESYGRTASLHSPEICCSADVPLGGGGTWCYVCIFNTTRLCCVYINIWGGGWREVGGHCILMYASQNIIMVIKSRRVRWAGHAACMREVRNVYKILVGKPERKRPCGRPRRRWEDNMRMGVREIEWKDVD